MIPNFDIFQEIEICKLKKKHNIILPKKFIFKYKAEHTTFIIPYNAYDTFVLSKIKAPDWENFEIKRPNYDLKFTNETSEDICRYFIDYHKRETRINLNILKNQAPKN